MLFSDTPEAIEWRCIKILNGIIVKHDVGSPRDADPEDLWAHLRIKYRDGGAIVDDGGAIWDIWKKNEGYVLHCLSSKETIEVPKPKKLGG